MTQRSMAQERKGYETTEREREREREKRAQDKTPWFLNLCVSVTVIMRM